MRWLSRWSYQWKPNQESSPELSDVTNLVPDPDKSPSKLKKLLNLPIGFLRWCSLIFVTMGLLWLLSVAIICFTSHMTSAWPEGNKETAKLAEALTTNNTSQIQTTANNTLPALNATQGSNNNSTVDNAREKRGTLLKESALEKREIPKFRLASWISKTQDEPVEEKRAKFSSWGGKRAEDDEAKGAKRAKFSSWGGKRDYSDSLLDKNAHAHTWIDTSEVDDINENKRAKFNSWAGKRTGEDDKRAKFSSWAGKRGKFNSWAGKRSDLDMGTEVQHDSIDSWSNRPESVDLNGYYLNEDKRAKFSSWAGKRNPDYLGSSWSSVSPDTRIKYYSSGMGEAGNENIMKLWQDLMSRKRARFSSWAGKRSEEIAPDSDSVVTYLDSDMQDKRAKFSSWAGKRDDAEKRKFSSWGGKRGVNESYGDIVEENHDGYPSIIVKRSVFTWNSPSVAYKRKPIFSSWGGKRSDAHTIQVRSLPIQRVLISGGNDRTWGSLMRPIRRGPDFYAWGGKRSA